MHIPSITNESDLAGKTVLIRAGLNVPVDEDGTILDDFRLVRFLPTLHYLVEHEAKVIVVAHIGRDPSDTLKSVAHYLNKQVNLTFKKDFFADRVSEHITQLQQEVEESANGSVFLLDNVRQTESEKADDARLAAQLAQGVDMYVNEAFSVSHRAHMSLHALPSQIDTRYVGIACSEELEQLGLALDPPTRSIAVISGNKFETKLPLIKRFLKSYESVVVGGALANTLYYLSGYNIGKSLYEDDLDEETTATLKEVLAHKKLYLPAIVVVGRGSGEKEIKHISEVTDEEYIYDIAPDGLVELEESIARSQLVVWNGPLGYYEGGYSEGTQRLLELLADSPAQSIIGGGNTVDAARDLGYEDRVTFLSTGGGAMIDYLTQGTLPALEVLQK